MSDFDLDQHIDDMVQGLAEKHPRQYRTPVGMARHLIETKILRRSHDQQAVDQIRRQAAKPMQYDDDIEARASRIILPPGAKK